MPPKLMPNATKNTKKPCVGGVSGNKDARTRVELCLDQVRQQYFNNNIDDNCDDDDKNQVNVCIKPNPILKNTGNSCKCGSQPLAQRPPPPKTNRKPLYASKYEPVKKHPLPPTRCPDTYNNFCACNRDETEVRCQLPQNPNITFCSNTTGDGCSKSKNTKNKGRISKRRDNTDAECETEIRIRPQDFLKGNQFFSGDNTSYEIITGCVTMSQEDCCCCEHGVPFEPDCCDCEPEPLPPNQKPLIIVQNKLCECESKWKLVERWQAAAKRRDEERRQREIKRDRDAARARCERRIQDERRHRQRLKAEMEREETRKKEEEMCRNQQKEMDEKRKLKQEEGMWIDEICDRQEARYYREVQERRREERYFREDQLRPLSMTNLAVPELEQLRRCLAPVNPGPNEIFEYYSVDPVVKETEQEKKERAEKEACALMGLTNKHGIRISLGDSQPKKASLKVNMGPCQGPMGNGGITIDSGCCKENCGGLVPEEVMNVMMKVKEMNSPLMRFNQTNPNWANLQSNLAFPNGLGNSLAHYYTGC